MLKDVQSEETDILFHFHKLYDSARNIDMQRDVLVTPEGELAIGLRPREMKSWLADESGIDKKAWSVILHWPNSKVLSVEEYLRI